MSNDKASPIQILRDALTEMIAQVELHAPQSLQRIGQSDIWVRNDCSQKAIDSAREVLRLTAGATDAPGESAEVRSPTYAELEVMYEAQCKCTDEWADKYNAVIDKTADATLQARIDELQTNLANVNAKLIDANYAAQVAANKPAEVDGEDLVLVPRGLLGAASYIISKTAPESKVLAKLRAITFERDEVDEPAAASGEAVAWVDQFGNTFPLSAYSVDGKPNWSNEHKRGWKRLYTHPAPVVSGEAFGFVNLNHNLFFTAAQWAATERNAELLESGQVVRVYTDPQQQVQAGGDAAARDVLAERQRQIHVEGWNVERDDRYTNCELARAAATYAVCSHVEQLQLCGERAWPWHIDWFKRTTYRRDLVKAGALILAEIERLDRDSAIIAALKGQKP